MIIALALTLLSIAVVSLVDLAACMMASQQSRMEEEQHARIL